METCQFCNSTFSWLHDHGSKIVESGKKIFLPTDNKFVRHATASFIGSIATILTLNPIFVLKVRLQNLEKQDTSIHTLNKEIRSIKRSKGIRGFWSGAGTALAMSIPNTVAYMTAYEKCKEILARKINKAVEPPLYISGLSGAIARMISATVVSPLELVRTMQSAGNSKGFFSIVRDVIRKDGIIGLYKGWMPTILRDCPFSAIYWYSFESIKPWTQRIVHKNSHEKMDEFSPTASLIAGSTAGSIAAIFTHPFDVLKTKQQLSHSQLQGAGIIYFLRNSSYQTLTRGLGLRLFSVIPACGIIITVYEGIKSVN